MYKDAAQQREYNRRKQAERRAKARTEKNTTPLALGSASSSPSLQGVAGVQPLSGEDETLLQVEVKTEEQEQPKLSLKDRLFGTRSSIPQPIIKKPVASRASKKQSENLVSTVLPTVIASFIATYSRQMLPDEYKGCAPSMEECNGILAPLLAIIGRRVEVVGKASQDAIDITNSIICSIAYGTRAYIVYAEIKHVKEQREVKRATEQGRDSQVASVGTGGNSTAGNDSRGQGSISSLNGNANHPESDTASRNMEAAFVAQMFERDKYGRVGLGLLPRELQ